MGQSMALRFIMTLPSYSSLIMTPCFPLTFFFLDNHLFFVLVSKRRDCQDMYSRPTSIFCTIAGNERQEPVLARYLANEFSMIQQKFCQKQDHNHYKYSEEMNSYHVNRARRS